MRARVACAILFAGLLTCQDSQATCKDPASPADAILDAIGEPLHKAGIDYRRRWSGLITLDPARPDSRA